MKLTILFVVVVAAILHSLSRIKLHQNLQFGSSITMAIVVDVNRSHQSYP
jgi:hypothetical protein